MLYSHPVTKEQFHSPSSGARELGVCESTMRRWIKSGRVEIRRGAFGRLYVPVRAGVGIKRSRVVPTSVATQPVLESHK